MIVETVYTAKAKIILADAFQHRNGLHRQLHRRRKSVKDWTVLIFAEGKSKIKTIGLCYNLTRDWIEDYAYSYLSDLPEKERQMESEYRSVAGDLAVL